MIRILHVVSSLSIGSGVLAVLMNYYRELDRDLIQFDFLSFKDVSNTYEEEILKLGGRVYHCGKPSFSSEFRNEMNAFFSLHKDEYQILHCHPIYAGPVFGSIAKKNGVKHVIQHSHTTKYSDKVFSKVRNCLMISIFHNCITDYMACSEEAKKIFWWKSERKIEALYNAIDFSKYEYNIQNRNEIRVKYGIKSNEVLIGHIGRFSKEKNHIFILQTFKEYLHKNKNAKLMLIGDGILFDKIKELSRELGIHENVIFVGRISNIADYLSAMDGFILPSIFEGLGIVLLEAQLAGLMCLASTNVPQEVNITGNVKFISLKESEYKWADELDGLLKQQVDRAEIFIKNENYDIKKAVKNLENYYQTLINK